MSREHVDVGVIIAVKRLTAAKTRLAPALSALARERLVLAMLLDTIAAAQQVDTIRGVTIVTPDAAAADAVRGAGAVVVDDLTPPGHPDPLNNAVRHAEAVVRRDTPEVMVLQGDLPAVRPAELAAAIAEASRHERSFVADRHGTGTAALFAFGVPLDPMLGSNSAVLHRESGASELTGSWPGLRCDIDTADDLAEARRIGVGAATAAAISSPDEHR